MSAFGSFVNDPDRRVETILLGVISGGVSAVSFIQIVQTATSLISLAGALLGFLGGAIAFYRSVRKAK